MRIDTVKSEESLEPVFEQIKRDAAEQRINFNDPANLLTVWSGGFSDRMQCCGSRRDIDSAWQLARDHENLKTLYIVHAGTMAFGITRFDKSAISM